MLSEAIQDLKNLVEKASFPRTIHPEAEPDHVYILARGDGTCEKLAAIPAPFQGQALALASLVAWLTKEGSDRSEVWYDPTHVVAIQEKGERRARLTMPLTETPQCKTIRGLVSKDFDQREFIKLAKIDLAREVPDFFLSLIRGVLFKKNMEAQSRVDPTKASVGRAIQTELDMEGKSFPDYINLRVQVFTLLPFVQDIQCSLDVDMERERFRLTPMPMEIDNAVMRALEQVKSVLCSSLTEENIPVYYGDPQLTD